MKTNLLVLFGGKSVEHEVSIISALQAMQNIDTKKFEIFPVYITKASAFFYGEELFEIENFKNIPSLLKRCKPVFLSSQNNRTFLFEIKGGKKVAELDVCLPVVHGTNVEDGALQGFLQTLGIPFASPSVLSSAICMDKYFMKVLLKDAGFPVLDGVKFKVYDEIKNPFDFPIIIKPINLGSSVGISIAKNEKEFEISLELAFNYSDEILIEPCLTDFKEINCAVIGNSEEAESSLLEQPFSEGELLSFSDKYISGNSGKGGAKGGSTGGTKATGTGGTKGGTSGSGTKGSITGGEGAKNGGDSKRRIPADLPKKVEEKIKDIAVKAFQYLECTGVARIDFMIDNKTEKIYINELNTIPGSLAFYLFEPAGIPYKELLTELINLAFVKKRAEEKLTFTFDSNILEGAKF